MDLISAALSKNSETLILFYKSHTKDQLNNFMNSFSSASSDQEKYIILKSYLGKNYTQFEQNAIIYAELNKEIVNRNIKNDVRQKITENYSFGAVAQSIASTAPGGNQKAYNHCCVMVIGTAVGMGAGCSAITATIGTAICVAAAMTYEAADIANCADTWL